jgi:hypothetical protein
MTISEARQVFSHLMTTARTRRLTTTEKTQLSYARQKLRSDRKGVRRNPGPKATREKNYVIASTGPDGQRIYLSPASRWIRDRALAKRYTEKDATSLAQLFQDRGNPAHALKLERPGFIRNPARKKVRSNPGEFIRMGKLVEIRYYRDHGRFKGFYKHPFKVRPDIYYRASDNSIFIKG